MDKYFKKTLYENIYSILKEHIDNAKAFSVAKDAITSLANNIDRYIDSRLHDAISPERAKNGLKMSREDIIQEIMISIKLASGKDKLAFISELNRLEDNYKSAAIDPEIIINVVSYKGSSRDILPVI